MPTGDERLADLLRFDGHNLGRRQVHALARNRSLAELRRYERTVPSFWPGLMHGVARALEPALDVPLKHVLAMGWNRYRRSLAEDDPDRQYADAITEVPLVEHTIDWSCDPCVEVLVDGQHLTDLEFKIEVEVDVESAMLQRRAGRLESVSMGTYKGSIDLSYENVVLDHQKFKNTIPGIISFVERPPIRYAQEQALHA